MFNPFFHLFIILYVLIYSTYSQAQINPEKPGKNPFSQPDFLKYTPPVKSAVEAVEIDEVLPEFHLTATFISVNGSMAIVNGHLLSLVEEVEGLQLIMVGEGIAKIRFKGKIIDIKIEQNINDKTLKIRRNVTQ